jgi:hypothetical protein
MLDNDHDYDNDNELPRDFCTAPLARRPGRDRPTPNATTEA